MVCYLVVGFLFVFFVVEIFVFGYYFKVKFGYGVGKLGYYLRKLEDNGGGKEEGNGENGKNGKDDENGNNGKGGDGKENGDKEVNNGGDDEGVDKYVYGGGYKGGYWYG